MYRVASIYKSRSAWSLLGSHSVALWDVLATVQAATSHGCLCVTVRRSIHWRRVTAAAAAAAMTRAARASGTSLRVSQSGTSSRAALARRRPSDKEEDLPRPRGLRVRAAVRWTSAHHCSLRAYQDQVDLNWTLSVRNNQYFYRCELFV